MDHPEAPRIADLIRAGRVRVALGLGSPALAMKDWATGKVRGPAWDLARALADRMGIELVTVEYPRPGAIMDGVGKEWDVTFLVVAQDRAAVADFSRPYMQSDFTYLVPADSPFRSVADADRVGVRIGVPRGDASDLRLSKTPIQAKLVRTDSPAAAVELLRTGQAEAYAAGRTVLLGLATQLPGARVLKDGFGDISYAAAVAKGQARHLDYVNEFIEEAKASGLVKKIIERAGLRGVQVVLPRAPHNENGFAQ
jgi:polar amino acid transport system substrate-binding protein